MSRNPSRWQQAFVMLGGLALFLAMATDAAAVIGRHVGMTAERLRDEHVNGKLAQLVRDGLHGLVRREDGAAHLARREFRQAMETLSKWVPKYGLTPGDRMRVFAEREKEQAEKPPEQPAARSPRPRCASPETV